MELLLKAHKTEESPYKAINQLTDKWEKYSHEVTRLLIGGVNNVLKSRLRKAAEDAALVFKGRVQYNPRTGKPIKISEWKRLEEAINKYLGIEKNMMAKKMINDSFWLGTLINRLDTEGQRIQRPLSRFDVDNPDFIGYNYTDYDLDRIEIEQRATGIYLQNITDRARSKIQTIIIEGTKQRKRPSKVFQDLWDQEEDINRDWDRVVKTETSYGTTNGLLISQLRQEPEEEHIFMKGISSPNACRHCLRLINEQVVVLKDTPTETGRITIEGVEYEVIWPEKSNYGRKSANYWPCIPLHPYCRCAWTRWYLELEALLGREAK